MEGGSVWVAALHPILYHREVLYNIALKIPEETGAEITDYSLDQNFPNPFNPTTTIRFGLPKEGKAAITVYTITGEYVATLVDREMTKGYHEVSFDASRLASGVYLYRIQAGEFTRVRKMMVIK